MKLAALLDHPLPLGPPDVPGGCTAAERERARLVFGDRPMLSARELVERLQLVDGPPLADGRGVQRRRLGLGLLAHTAAARSRNR